MDYHLEIFLLRKELADMTKRLEYLEFKEQQRQLARGREERYRRNK